MFFSFSLAFTKHTCVYDGVSPTLVAFKGRGSSHRPARRGRAGSPPRTRSRPSPPPAGLPAIPLAAAPVRRDTAEGPGPGRPLPGRGDRLRRLRRPSPPCGGPGSARQGPDRPVSSSSPAPPSRHRRRPLRGGRRASPCADGRAPPPCPPGDGGLGGGGVAGARSCPFKARHHCGGAAFRADQVPLD